MKPHELALDEECKEKLDTVRVYGCSLCHTTRATLRRYGKGYICPECITKLGKGVNPTPPQQIVVSPIERVAVSLGRRQKEVR